MWAKTFFLHFSSLKMAIKQNWQKVPVSWVLRKLSSEIFDYFFSFLFFTDKIISTI
jgi:hypothetical protein